MDIHELLAKVTDDSGRAIAKKVGLPERTVLHQISTGRMPLDNVIKITAAYGYSPIRALIDLGELDATWSQVPDVEAALRLATDEQLTDEFLRRLKAAPNPDWDAPVGDLEAARRARKSNTDNLYGVPDVLPTGYVADGTDTEPEMGDDDYSDGP